MDLGATHTATIQAQYPKGTPRDADALPTATLYRNGVLTAVPVTITNISTGVYSYAFAVPASWTVGDEIDLHLSAVINSISCSDIKRQEWSANSELDAYPNKTSYQSSASTDAAAIAAAVIAQLNANPATVGADVLVANINPDTTFTATIS